MEGVEASLVALAAAWLPHQRRRQLAVKTRQDWHYFKSLFRGLDGAHGGARHAKSTLNLPANLRRPPEQTPIRWHRSINEHLAERRQSLRLDRLGRSPDLLNRLQRTLLARGRVPRARHCRVRSESRWALLAQEKRIGPLLELHGRLIECARELRVRRAFKRDLAVAAKADEPCKHKVHPLQQMKAHLHLVGQVMGDVMRPVKVRPSIACRAA